MGRVLVEALVENLQDVWDLKRGLLTEDKVRRVDASDALVDTGATYLSLPKRLIQQLGLDLSYRKRAMSSIGPAVLGVYQAVRLTIQGRSCVAEVVEVPDDVPILIGQLPLESLDFVIDMKTHALIGNPAHGGEHVLEMY
ncbi:MAG TPA: aspartyl protease family protein [Gemmataceae bacterium]|nr:aspartyl protease family protein [Gemmataceae bacterium]